MMDGRVLTLHPKEHGGICSPSGATKSILAAQWTRHPIKLIDLLVANFYPFEAAVAKGASYDECIETIDIGGPAMIRAAAKNHMGCDSGRRTCGLCRRGGRTGGPHSGMRSLALRQKTRRKSLWAAPRLTMPQSPTGSPLPCRSMALRLPRFRRKTGRGLTARRPPTSERRVLPLARRTLMGAGDRKAVAGKTAFRTTTSTTLMRLTNA